MLEENKMCLKNMNKSFLKDLFTSSQSKRQASEDYRISPTLVFRFPLPGFLFFFLKRKRKGKGKGKQNVGGNRVLVRLVFWADRG